MTGANQEIRDHSGKKARQYLAAQEAAVSQDTFRSKFCFVSFYLINK